MCERPNTGTEETVESQAPQASEGRQGQKKVHSLIDKVFSRKNLALAWEKVKSNRGSAGIDGVTIAQFEARQEYYLDLLHRKLRDGTYRPKPVKRVEIPKAEGGVRKLGIPAVLDRVCQQALSQRMEPIFQPTFLDSAFGYRRGRAPHEAMRKVWQEPNAGYGWIVDADLRQFFDNIPHGLLMKAVEKRIADRRVLQVIRQFLAAGYMEQWQYHRTYSGTPQGGVFTLPTMLQKIS